ncbi:hypothetical protein [Paenibacillus sp. YYML68]|uniref:hypothetical protein n=1 Tax=Paenibacillus sp. YYML68 TaxID=2909250 RepID=UPI0024936AA6|nr:hypothetical protein [Paenibacillus sp. YYML68]
MDNNQTIWQPGQASIHHTNHSAKPVQRSKRKRPKHGAAHEVRKHRKSKPSKPVRRRKKAHHHRSKHNHCRIPSTINVCDNQVRLRLAGLTGNLNFQLLRAKGCRVTIEFEGAQGQTEVSGEIASVGTDYVDIAQVDRTVVTIMQSRIIAVRWDDPSCRPGDVKKLIGA